MGKVFKKPCRFFVSVSDGWIRQLLTFRCEEDYIGFVFQLRHVNSSAT